MEIKLKRSIAEALGVRKFKPFGLDENAWSWKQLGDIDLARLTKKQLDDLEAIFKERPKLHGVGVLLKDIATWRAATTVDAGTAKARTVPQFEALLGTYLRDVAGHRVYERHGDDEWLCFYVDHIRYHEERRDRGDYFPAYVEMILVWEEFGGKKKRDVDFFESDCRSMPVVEALARKGYYVETPELRAAYLSETKRYGEITRHVGKQFWAVGIGTDDLDGNPKGRHDSSWYWNRNHTYQLADDGGEGSRVVIDVFYEDPSTDRNQRNKVHIDTWFWVSKLNAKKELKKKEGKEKGDESDYNNEEKDATEENRPEIEIPIHPLCAVFLMSKHLRLRVHVNNLTEYKYDPKLADKLVLSEELKTLIHMLIEHKSGAFKDIVRNKSGGAVVLLAGPAGTGKTLTAEIYAEAEQRPLYSIQCSQLGTDPDELEDELLKVFARAQRWNAVLLLDEADVYVHERGLDLQQNAVVGVFLRVLEYQASVLFLTTNRPKDVDDAIASRCIARLNYEIPSVADQARIWRVLADGSGIKIDDATIVAVSKANQKLSGRDVKMLLKLAHLVSAGEEVLPDAVEFVKQFRPTNDGK